MRVDVRTTGLTMPLVACGTMLAGAALGTVNGFFVAAIVAYVKLIKRKQIDAKFAAMSSDASYQKEAKLITEEFSQSDWEALEMAGE